MWVLATDDKSEQLFTFRMLPGTVKTMGRAPNADFMMDAAMVSRLHCRLSAGAWELEVEDLDSTNGTFVNGRRIERGVLKNGDELGVGRVMLKVLKAQP
jgi:pSer/pThr/pTyr-binding forkhead associated (FHA) protein